MRSNQRAVSPLYLASWNKTLVIPAVGLSSVERMSRRRVDLSPNAVTIGALVLLRTRYIRGNDVSIGSIQVGGFYERNCRSMDTRQCHHPC